MFISGIMQVGDLKGYAQFDPTHTCRPEPVPTLPAGVWVVVMGDGLHNDEPSHMPDYLIN